MITVSDCVGLFQTFNTLQDNTDLSDDTRVKCAQNKAAIQPVIDYFNKKVQQLQAEVMKLIPASITDEKEKNNFFVTKWMLPETQKRLEPVSTAEVEVQFLKFTQEELKEADLSGPGLGLFVKLGLYASVIEESSEAAPVVESAPSDESSSVAS